MDNQVDKEAVERLRDMITYLAKVALQLTDVFHPIARLAQQDVDWD